MSFITLQIEMLLFCVDPSLGRADYASLLQQALMEMFIDGISNREKICGSKEEPKGIEEWKGVTVKDKEEVIKIDWFQLGLKGTLNLQWLPSTVQMVIVFENDLTGSIDLTSLPPSMKQLYLSNNKFSGEIDLTHLPDGMEALWLSENQLSGPIDLTKLPAGLQALYLYDNNFLGKTDFSQLPKSLQKLNVSHTHLSGEIRISGIHLQERMNVFNVSTSHVKIVMAESNLSL